MDNQKTNIVEQITGGLVNIDSVEEFEKILEDFPEDPAFHKAYADLLVKNNFSDISIYLDTSLPNSDLNLSNIGFLLSLKNS